MATLETFIRTGTLGPLVTGMPLPQVIDALGPPDGQSRKANPLHLKYGAAQLVFLRSTSTLIYKLREIGVMFQPVYDQLPTPIAFEDWSLHQPPTEQQFISFIRQIACEPVVIPKFANDRELSFASGVVASIVDGMLHSIRFVERDAKQSKAMPFLDGREPSETQIREMLDEADQAKLAGAHRAALLLEWAALEAALRQRVQRAGGLGKVGLQPSILIHELFAAGGLTQEEHQKLEQLRQLRSAIAHGLAPTQTIFNDSVKMRSLVTQLLAKD